MLCADFHSTNLIQFCIDSHQPTDCLSEIPRLPFILLVFGENLKLVTDSLLFLEEYDNSMASVFRLGPPTSIIQLIGEETI